LGESVPCSCQAMIPSSGSEANPPFTVITACSCVSGWSGTCGLSPSSS
jgi:hypothetical protein